ncbi:MAG: PIN domain-containing protein [Pseudomonadota bacterium]|nr:PIN domain-containing protein [Pseudomonadota bacterium]
MARSFLDTNILLYSDDSFDARKNQIAVDLLADLRITKAGVISTQVLQEYFANAVGKLNLDVMLARRRVELFAKFDVVIPSLELILAAIDLQRLNSLSFWDAMIVQAARVSGCEILLSEDMQHGQTIAGLRIVNPFA